jgi:hypothetical protein
MENVAYIASEVFGRVSFQSIQNRELLVFHERRLPLAQRELPKSTIAKG